MIDRALTLLSDERLAQLTSGGSDAAFGVIYRRYSATLFGYCRSITRNGDDAWDALQNAMVKVLIALRRAERDAPLRPWLFCIAHNESIGVLRRRASAARVEDGAAGLSVVALGADEQAESREAVAEVVSDVRELPTSQRAALVMRELGDLAYDEIAVALQTTEGNARQLVFAARAGLKDSRAGRGLPCESVRDQLSAADGRLLRRRSVRAHLRTCEGCSQFASSVRRRAGAPAGAVGAWSPLAGSSLLDSILRAGAAVAPAGGVGAGLVGSFGAKAATVAAVAVAGVGVADVPSAVAPASKQQAMKETSGGVVAPAVETRVVVGSSSPRRPLSTRTASVTEAEPRGRRSVEAPPRAERRPERDGLADAVAPPRRDRAAAHVAARDRGRDCPPDGRRGGSAASRDTRDTRGDWRGAEPQQEAARYEPRSEPVSAPRATRQTSHPTHQRHSAARAPQPAPAPEPVAAG